MNLAGNDTDAQSIYSDYEGDPDFKEILCTFVSAVADMGPTLRNSFETGDRSKIRDLAHQLKGTGGGYGFKEVTRLAAAVEASCKNPEHATALEVTLPRLIDYLARITTKSGPDLSPASA